MNTWHWILIAHAFCNVPECNHPPIFFPKEYETEALCQRAAPKVLSSSQKQQGYHTMCIHGKVWEHTP